MKVPASPQLWLGFWITLLPTVLWATPRSSITQWDITFTFDKAYETGQFANGDWWVVGPITLTATSPAFDGLHHGFEINPSNKFLQGFDVRGYGSTGAANFDASLVPTLPRTITPPSSILKTISVDISTDECRPCLQTAAVLTVLDSAPTGGGGAYFRPPYFANVKPLISTTSLHPELLPSLTPTLHTPTLATAAAGFQRVQLDHIEDWIGRNVHPIDNSPDYGSSIASRNAEGALRLMLNDSLSDRWPLLLNFTQYGLDLYYMQKGGVTWPNNGGHMVGRKMVITFAAVLLDNAEMKSAVSQAGINVYDENGSFRLSRDGQVLYGQNLSGAGENGYWTNVVLDHDSRTQMDPYRYIDGGRIPGDYYQYCCLSQPWKGQALATALIPEMRTVWNDPKIFDYVDRWVRFGAWSQPDPCAPAESTMANYGITFGPLPGHPGECIPDTNPSDGIGRFPARHGTARDEGYYASAFVNAMYSAYGSVLADTVTPTISLSAPASGANVSGTAVLVSAQASDNSGIASVSLQLDGNPLGPDITLSPYSAFWDSTASPQGPHTLTAVARDLAGNTAVSTPILVTVNPTESGSQPKPHAYPVPWNPLLGEPLTLKNIPSNSEVFVFDPSGSLVHTFRTPGDGQPYQWDGRDKSGQQVPSGIYLLTWNQALQSHSLKIAVQK